MHELSIAESIVRIADAHAAGRRVTKVEVKVGHLRQVVPSALEFAFELVAQVPIATTPHALGARRSIHQLSVSGSPVASSLPNDVQ